MSDKKYLDTGIQLRDYTSTLMIPQGELSMFIGHSNSGKTRAAVKAAATLMANKAQFKQCIFVTQDTPTDVIINLHSQFAPNNKGGSMWHVVDGISSMEDLNNFCGNIITATEIPKENTLIIIDASFHLDQIESYKGATIIKTETVPEGGSTESFFRLIILNFVVHIMSIRALPEAEPKLIAVVMKDKWGSSNQGGTTE